MRLLGKFLEVSLPSQRYFNFEKKINWETKFPTTYLISVILTVGKCGCLVTLSKMEICFARF